MALKPLLNRVILERPIAQKVGSILIPDTIAKRSAQEKGVVLAVGDGADETVKSLVGQTVMFGRFAGDWLKEGDREYYVCNDEDLLAVVEGETNA